MRNQTFINCSYSMKKFLFIPALCLLFASCGGDKGPDGGGVPSLKVEPSSLDFAAVSAPSQSVTVTAVNVEWEVRVSDTASAWLKAEKTDGTTVTVSVTDNGTPEQRTGFFTVVPTNNEDVKAKSVTVVQTGSDVEYKFSVELSPDVRSGRSGSPDGHDYGRRRSDVGGRGRGGCGLVDNGHSRRRDA